MPSVDAPDPLHVVLGWVVAAIGFAAAIDSVVGALLGYTGPGWCLHNRHWQP